LIPVDGDGTLLVLYRYFGGKNMKISRAIILLSFVSSCFAVTMSVDNESACDLIRVGTGQLPEVQSHHSPDSIPAHSRATIEADLSAYGQSSDEYIPFFDLYVARCGGQERAVYISGDQSTWYAEIIDDDTEEFKIASYSVPLVLVDAR
jgi:hypothetical protein